MALRGLAVLSLFLVLSSTASPQPPPNIAISILDQEKQPVPGVLLHLKTGDVLVSSAETDLQGHAAFVSLKPSRYEITATRDGFEPVRRDLDLSGGESKSIELTVVPVVLREKVEVRGTVAPVELGASTPSELSARVAKELPSRPATVADALPLIPGVVREPGGGLVISAAAEHRSALIVNSADVTDPATGQFGLTVPIDSVETLSVYQAPFLAEFGRFTAGLVSVETRRGGDKWKWELNDPRPEFRIRSWELRGP